MAIISESDRSSRIRLLAEIGDPLPETLPSPPSSPRLQSASTPKGKDRGAKSGPGSVSSVSSTTLSSSVTSVSATSSGTKSNGAQTRNGNGSAGSTFNAPKPPKSVVPPPKRPSNDDPHYKEYWRKQAANYRQVATKLKRQSDQLARDDPSSQEGALLIQLDCIGLFAYSFWCDDQASRTCLSSNWDSLMGLLRFVKNRADKLDLEDILSMCDLIEAFVGEVLNHAQRRSLFHRATHYLDSTTSSSSSENPVSTQDMTSILKSISRFAADVTKVHRCWGSSASGVTSPTVLSTRYPGTWQAILTHHCFVRPDSDTEPNSPYRYAWPLQLFGKYAPPHIISFCREILKEYARNIKFNYKPENI